MFMNKLSYESRDCLELSTTVAESEGFGARTPHVLRIHVTKPTSGGYSGMQCKIERG